ncbi:Putative amino acid/polyamine transporter I, amino acid permease [Septoria linicola]|uniref:Amino acid/polyamine transporter I, amino acid permease n=1 Tax=Septoria linicola TaxID=215465 RepID=A0A9Q9B5Q8_9PEZI|nr:putative amino acid/polyamine transporter I, amino acid permease [Septoria linicola]USW59468.1 Putative amino acid/polyamine transporter I, amino acid permease [Septoria linicola]
MSKAELYNGAPTSYAPAPEDTYRRTSKLSNGLGKEDRYGNDVMTDGPRRLNSVGSVADDVLAAMGYTQELVRNRSTLSVAFMSFVLASVPYGLSTTLIYPLTNGGPSTVIWGWCLVCALMLCVAISLGEITSVYPTAGGVYFQTYMLSPRWCRKLAAWMTGWCFVLGNMIITLSVNFGTTLFLIGCINIFRGEPYLDVVTNEMTTDGIFVTEPYMIYLIFIAVTFVCTAISALLNKHLPLIDTLTVGFTFVGVLAIIICGLAIAAEGRRSASYAFGHFEVLSGWNPPGWAFCIGLLHAAYATSATGMVVSMCEEVQKPAEQVPKALVGALVLNWACGFIFLVPLMFVLPDLVAVTTDPTGQPLPAILGRAIGNQGGAFALCVPIIILGFFCGTGCTTAASRCTWAFARDGAIPGSRKLKFDTVNRKLDIPLNAMLLVVVVQLVLGVIYLGSTSAFNAFNGSGVIFLTLSYVIPVAVSFCSGRKKLVGARYNFGAFGAFCNVVAMAWCAFAIPLFSMPTYLPIDAIGMNYGSVVFVFGVGVALAWYYIWGRKNYSGPRVDEDPVAGDFSPETSFQ